MAEIKMQDRGQPTWKDQIRQAVDSTMSNQLIHDFETFRDDLKQKAIDVWERGKDLTYQLTGTNYKARGKKLGTAYEKGRSEEHTSELQSRFDLVCRLLLEKKNRILR